MYDMNYEIVTQIGYIGACLFAIFTIFLFWKLQIIQCIRIVSGVEHKKRLKDLCVGGTGTVNNQTSIKKTKLSTTEPLIMGIPIQPAIEENSEEIAETVLLEEEQTNILYLDEVEAEQEEMRKEFVVLKDIVVVHTEERL